MRLTVFLMLLLSSLTLEAQGTQTLVILNELPAPRKLQERRVSIWGGITGVHSGHSAAALDTGTAGGVEVHLPSSNISLVASYGTENTAPLKGAVASSLSYLELGARYQFRPNDFYERIVPYVGLGVAATLEGSAHGESSYYYQGTPYPWRISRYSKPAITLAPSVGVSMYFFGNLAVYVDYSLRLGLGGRLEAEQVTPMFTEHLSRGFIRHMLSFGFKISFPFKVTRQDGEYIVDRLIQSAIGL